MYLLIWFFIFFLIFLPQDYSKNNRGTISNFITKQIFIRFNEKLNHLSTYFLQISKIIYASRISQKLDFVLWLSYFLHFLLVIWEKKIEVVLWEKELVGLIIYVLCHVFEFVNVSFYLYQKVNFSFPEP